ncbi:MAG TPA: glycosyltransferase family 1 protein, partial [Pirellulales bacterium]|nr:glycosyltransferase family 1 protein [Pirellulales bacterium]
MRIGVDMLADQSAGRTRGTGRYARGLVGELRRASQHEFFPYYYDGLPQTADLFGPHVPVRTLPTSGSLHAAAHQLANENRDELDVLLLTCPLENFYGYLPPFPSRSGLRLAAIVYDLIPLRFPDQYLHHPGIAQSYRRALAALRQYDVLLTISESGRRDVIELLRVSPDRVVNIGAGSDAGFFYPAETHSAASHAARWLAEQGIEQPFVYALTALDYRKNLSGLLAAFERLPARLIASHQFVVTCASSNDDDARRARDVIARSAIGQRIVLSESLDDAGLRTLYQHAAALVFPSRYEGFGLPLLEAMQCGTPVVAGRNSSQIEVVGDAGLLADVDDAQDLANKIAAMLDDRRLADEFRVRGLEQAGRFTWPAVAQRCLDAL